MKPIQNTDAGPLAGLTVQVKYWDGISTGARRADAIGSQIIVDAGPVDAIARIGETGSFTGKTVAYVVTGTDHTGRFDTAYVGSGSSDTRLQYQVGKSGVGTTFAARQVYVLHARDPRIADTVARYIEAHLIETGFALGVRLTNKVAAIAPDLGDDHLVDSKQMDAEIHLFLPAAGCAIFEGLGAAANYDDDEDLPLRDGYCVVAENAFVPPDGAPLLRLDRPNLFCQGYQLGDHLIVRPGSQFKIKEGTGGLRPANIRRRAAIQSRDILEPEPTKPDRKRLTAWVKFECPKVAARVMSGIHSTVVSWVPVTTEPNGCDAIEQGGDHAPRL
jgi:hypothetical protein